MASAQMAKRIVVKVGTSTLTHETGKPNLHTINQLCRVLSDLWNSGMEVVLVTSGAVGAGLGRLGLDQRPSDVATRQAVAAIGQCELMSLYSKFFSEYGRSCAQVLLTADDIGNGTRRQNLTNCLSALLGMGVIPVINENDAVSVSELEGSNIGDNDNLSALVAELIDAGCLIMLTDIDGLYDKDPRESDSAVRIPVVAEITEHIRGIAGGSGSKRGTGGMSTKLDAAERAGKFGIDTYIMSGKNPEDLYHLLDGKPIGTRFVAK